MVLVVVVEEENVLHHVKRERTLSRGGDMPGEYVREAYIQSVPRPSSCIMHARVAAP